MNGTKDDCGLGLPPLKDLCSGCHGFFSLPTRGSAKLQHYRRSGLLARHYRPVVPAIARPNSVRNRLTSLMLAGFSIKICCRMGSKKRP